MAELLLHRRETRQHLLFLILLLVLAMLSGCALAKASDLRDFTSDGCSLFPDGTIGDRIKWCQCCLLHDIAYWRGGTACSIARKMKRWQRPCISVSVPGAIPSSPPGTGGHTDGPTAEDTSRLRKMNSCRCAGSWMNTGKIIRRDTAWKNTGRHRPRKKKNRDEYKSCRLLSLDAGFYPA